ncbi:MAG TPA: TetR/AcrR family transcriptional regulator [Sphingobium sp.]|nr:TetR/AcrR family transcriptional regulator [Sphingobium sp.]
MDQLFSPSMDARRARSRKALRNALLALIEERPFEQITIREITAKADVGYATFFRHFATKEDLLNNLAEGQIRELLSRTVPLLDDIGSRDAVRATCAYVDEHRALWTALLTGGAAGTVREEFVRQARTLELNVEPSKRTHELPGDLAVVYGTGGTIDILAWWLSQDVRYSVDEIADLLNELVIASLQRGPMERRSSVSQA